MHAGNGLSCGVSLPWATGDSADVLRGNDEELRHGFVFMKQRGQVSGVQMFSFLDAMVCTVGALLVLLHAFSHHGQVEAERKAKAKAAEQSGENPEVELEMLTWRIEQLREVRKKTETQLADERLKLAHVEDHQRRLRARAEELTAELAEMDRIEQTGEARTLRDLAALEAARVRLTEARDAVERARKQHKRAASYSVVPYEGPHRTRRRPVYVECRQDMMVLQPEGIELTPGDFAGFLGAGNPLASAVRGAREYYAAKSPAGKPASEPYPLLLVRPDGIATYYAARRALDSWGSEFGYELIGGDWNLEFSQPDPQLAELMRQIVNDARRRMRELMLATAELHSSRPRVTLRASSSGGFVAEPTPRSGGVGRSVYRGSGWDSLDSRWARGGFGSGNNDSDDTAAVNNDALVSGRNSGGRTDRSAAGRTGSADQPGATGSGASGALASGAHGGSGDRYSRFTDRQSEGQSGRHADGSGDGNGAEQFGAGGREAGSPGSRQPKTNQLADGPNVNGPDSDEQFADDQSVAGRSGDGQSGADQTRDGAEGSQNGDTPDSGSQNASNAGEQQGASQYGRPTSGQPSSMGSEAGDGGSCAVGSHPQQPSGASNHSSSSQHRSQMPAAIATLRGRDWGLPDAGAGMTPVTRPIAVVCHADRLVILPEDRGQVPSVTRLGDDARGSVDEFVSKIWRHMKGWGMAGRGLYWRPTLLVSVGPGGADRFAELQALLADSGLDVRLRQHRAAATRTSRPSARPAWTHR